MATLPPALRSTDEEEPEERWRAAQARALTQWAADQQTQARLIQLKLRSQRFAPGMLVRLCRAEAIPYMRVTCDRVCLAPAVVEAVIASGVTGASNLSTWFDEETGAQPTADPSPLQQALVTHLGEACTLEEIIHLAGTPYAATVRFGDGFRADVFIDALDPLTPPEPLR